VQEQIAVVLGVGDHLVQEYVQRLESPSKARWRLAARSRLRSSSRSST
jgi:hypothetical protein